MAYARQSLPLDDLVVYCVSEILNSGEECTFERLVYECFTRFPDTFGLKRYPKWPDSARVNKAWLRCRTDKGWIVGSVQEGFRLTSVGEHIAGMVATRLEAGIPSARSAGTGSRTRERHETLLRNIRSDSLFQRFVESQDGFELSEMEFRRFLGVTMETPVRILRQNLNAYKNAATGYGDEGVLDFLAACEKMMAPLINPAGTGRKPNDRSNRRGDSRPAH